MPERVTLVGLDFGTTTSSAVVAEADVARSAGTGRVEFGELRVRYRSEMNFTPLSDGERLDVGTLEAYLDDWLAAGNVQTDDVFGGGALLTGLTAQRDNAAAVIELVSRRLGDALIATADDPRLESWLAFMGSCMALSRANPDRPVLNLDIGGGTTNLAVGLNGEVFDTGCLFIGARHVRVEPGSYRVTALSTYANAILKTLGIRCQPGDELRADQRDAFVGLQVAMLESSIGLTGAHPPAPIQELLTQVAFRHRGLPSPTTDSVGDDPSVTFTGGIGELIYAYAAGNGWPGTTRFGDLGIELAQRIVASPGLSRHIRSHRPASAGRATALGLMRHCTEVSGSTLFLPDPTLLPLADVPIFGTIGSATDDVRLQAMVELVQRSQRGGCLIVETESHGAASLRTMGERLAGTLEHAAFRPEQLLVLLVRKNIGKALGQYVTRWGAQPWRVVVIDEVTPRDAQYVRVGRPRSGIVPVSFYGLNDV